MIRTYNDTCSKKHKKSKPDPNPIQSQCKPNPNPKKAKPNPFQTQFQKAQISLEAIRNFYTISLPAAKSRRNLYQNVQITGEPKC
jgi:hypothetical protein